MLDFCAEHDIHCDIEMLDIQNINDAYERIRKSDVKYRFVIDMVSLKWWPYACTGGCSPARRHDSLNRSPESFSGQLGTGRFNLQLKRTDGPMTVIKHDHVIVFDGVCLICCASFRFIYRRDKAGVFRFATAQSQPGHDILQSCGLPTDHYETMVYVKNDVVLQRSDAMLQILRQLPQPWPMVSLARFCPRFLRDGCYTLIARNRYRIFGKRDTCLVPTEDLLSRFL